MQYQDLLKAVGEIEAGSAKAELTLIDISGISAAPDHARPQFRKLLASAMDMESFHMLDMQQRQRPQQAKQVLQMQSSGQAQESTAAAAPPRMQKQAESAAGEISIFAGGLPEQGLQQVNTFNIRLEEGDKLVLPKLSTSDQIAELERIIEGLNEHVFDREQLGTIKKEISGLRSKISEERRSGAYGSGSGSMMEQSLIVLRDQRLADIIAMMRDIK